jgi:hypothetical protein
MRRYRYCRAAVDDSGIPRAQEHAAQASEKLSDVNRDRTANRTRMLSVREKWRAFRAARSFSHCARAIQGHRGFPRSRSGDNHRTQSERGQLVRDNDSEHCTANRKRVR